jgi:hypothetical protein
MSKAVIPSTIGEALEMEEEFLARKPSATPCAKSKKTSSIAVRFKQPSLSLLDPGTEQSEHKQSTENFVNKSERTGKYSRRIINWRSASNPAFSSGTLKHSGGWLTKIT